MSDRCPLCNEIRRLEGHHPSGRFRGKPIHPALVFLICWVCNNAQNLLWQRQGIDDKEPSREVVARRLALWIDLWGERPMTAEQRRALADAVAGLSTLQVTP